MNDKIFNIIIACIPLIGAIVSGYAIPYIKSKTAQLDLDRCRTWANQAVKCAEMIFTSSYSGPQKKEFCKDLLTDTINQSNIKLTDEQLDMLIEAAVKELHIAENIRNK